MVGMVLAFAMSVSMRTVLWNSILPRYLDKYLLLSTGSEAIDCAIKIAIDNGYRVLTHEHSYHGSTIGAEWRAGYGRQVRSSASART